MKKINFILYMAVLASLVAAVILSCNNVPVKTYYGSSVADLQLITLSHGVLTPSFNLNITSYDSTVDLAVPSITVTPVKADDSSRVTVDGVFCATYSPSQDIALNAGDNIIIVEVVSQDSKFVKDYIITVNKS